VAEKTCAKNAAMASEPLNGSSSKCTFRL